jgi:hypothetical protein
MIRGCVVLQYGHGLFGSQHEVEGEYLAVCESLPRPPILFALIDQIEYIDIIDSS